jgi:hypothetical protein
MDSHVNIRGEPFIRRISDTEFLSYTRLRKKPLMQLQPSEQGEEEGMVTRYASTELSLPQERVGMLF